MTVSVSRTRWDEHGAPTVTIVATGVFDVYRRLADHMTCGQVEFAKIGFRMLRALQRRVDRDRFAALVRRMHGDANHPRIVHPAVLSDAELDEIDAYVDANARTLPARTVGMLRALVADARAC